MLWIASVHASTIANSCWGIPTLFQLSWHWFYKLTIIVCNATLPSHHHVLGRFTSGVPLHHPRWIKSILLHTLTHFYVTTHYLIFHPSVDSIFERITAIHILTTILYCLSRDTEILFLRSFGIRMCVWYSSLFPLLNAFVVASASAAIVAAPILKVWSANLQLT